MIVELNLCSIMDQEVVISLQGNGVVIFLCSNVVWFEFPAPWQLFLCKSLQMREEELCWNAWKH